MGEFFEQHGEGGDVKAARPENRTVPGDEQHAKTKVDIAPNRQEGPHNEPSHSGQRLDR